MTEHGERGKRQGLPPMLALAKQYEIARIDKAKDATVIQGLDSAVSPERKAKPKRRLIVLVTAFIGLFTGVVAAFIREGFDQARRDPAKMNRLQALCQHLGTSK